MRPKNSGEMREKRKLKRFDLEIDAKIKAVISNREFEALSLRTSDICSCGAFFPTPWTLPEGTAVKVEMVLPLGNSNKLKKNCALVRLQITGKILRREPRGMAISFGSAYKLTKVNGSYHAR